MVIIGGNEAVSVNERLYFGENIDASAPRDLICRTFDKNQLGEYKALSSQKVPLLLRVLGVRDLVCACIVGAKYVAANKEDAPTMQKIVDDYLYDTKVLALIDSDDEIEWVAMHGIDGALFIPKEFTK